MVKELYTVYDKIAEESGPVFEANNEGIAVRQTNHLLSQKGINPQEYQLLFLGYIDKKSGTITPTEVIMSIDILAKYKKAEDLVDVK